MSESRNPLDREKRNIRIGKKRTSINIENYLWESLERIAKQEGQSVDEICTRIVENYTGKKLSNPALIRYVTHEVAREANAYLYSGTARKSGKSRKTRKTPKAPPRKSGEWSDNILPFDNFSPFEAVLARLRKL